MFLLSFINKKNNNIKLIIPSINLNYNIRKNQSNFNNLNSSLVYFNNIDPNNKIIIFGHSMMGKGVLFNRIDELKNNDICYLYINKNKYKYFVNNIYLVNKNKVQLLDEEKDSKKLILITCSKKYKNKRLIVELLQKC